MRLLTITLPDRPWIEPFTLFRCHGRFFWTVGYALLAGGVTVVDRAASRPWRVAVLTAAVALQADMSQMLLGLHERFQRPEALAVPNALLGPAFRGRDIRAYPAFFCTTSSKNQEVLRQLSVIVQRQDASINAAETARTPVGACERPSPLDARVDAAPGDRRLTVLTRDGHGATNAFAGQRDCFAYDDFWICGRDLEGVAGLRRVAGRALVEAVHEDLTVDVTSPAGRAVLVSGWAKPEPTGVWSIGPQAVLRMRSPGPPTGANLVLTMDALGFQPAGRPPQRAFVSVAGRSLGQLRLGGGGYQPLKVTLPADLLSVGGDLEVVLDLPDTISPDSVTPGAGDPRRLDIGLRRVSLAH